MKSNELMIGDWVYYGDKPVRVLQLSDGKDYPQIKPIPLTAEILEKNGWYRAKFDGGYGRKAMRLEGPYNELNELPEGVENALFFAQWSIDESFEYHLLDIYMWKGGVHIWIEYVHELQRVLRCCGLVKLADSFVV